MQVPSLCQTLGLPPPLGFVLLLVDPVFAVGDGTHAQLRICAKLELRHHVFGDPLHLPQVVGGLVFLGVRLAGEGVVVARGRGVGSMNHEGIRVSHESEVHGIELEYLHDLRRKQGSVRNNCR